VYPEDLDALMPLDKAQFARLPSRTQVACCIHMLEAEVNNDGFYGFFFNVSGEYVRETLVALERIGAPHTQALLERAVTLAFPDGYPTDAKDHQNALADYDEVADALEPLDTEFFRYPEPLADLVNAHLARDL
jgi:Domain of unknown function (DUF4375)